MSGKLRLVVMGTTGQCPFGGGTWMYLSWLRGLAALGHDVWYVEDDPTWPYDPVQNTVTDDCTYAVRHVASCMEKVGLPDRWAFRLADRQGACWGLSEAALNDLYRSCDALLNVVGSTDLREEQMAAPYRIYIECDPVGAQLEIAGGSEYRKAEFDKYHRIATYGENFGSPDCGVPLCGRTYLKTRQPVDLEFWPMAYDSQARFFTTIGNYRQSGYDVSYQGEVYRWSKHHEWEKLLDLPSRTSQPFELALKVDDPDRERLETHGWQVVPALEMSIDVFGAYREYFRRSRAEFTVAKDQNVRLRSGWFSERDACYLACGKPVVAQDTGFSNILPTGEGLFGFSTVEEAVAAIEAINSDYARHCNAARRIAEEYFEARRVAATLLADVGLA